MDFWKSKRVLITGHTGFKGSWLTLWLKMSGAEVCGYALPPDTKPSLFEDLKLEKQIKSVTGNVCDLEELEKTVQKFKPEIIFHLAAQSLVRRSYRQPVETYQTNVIGTINLLEVVRRAEFVKAVVVVTTDKVYENKEWVWGYRENDRLGGFDPYSNSKACAELAVSAYRNSFFAESETLIATARAGNVIGGGDWAEDRLLPDVFRSLIFGKSLEIRNPNSIRPWQFVLEPLRGYMMLAEKLYKGKRMFADGWNFGPVEDSLKSVDYVLRMIISEWLPQANHTISRTGQFHETQILKLDSTKAKHCLHWSQKLETADSVKLTIDWYRVFEQKGDLLNFTENQINSYQLKNL